MPYKILDLYRDLPRTNCGECGKATCFCFAGAIFLEGASLGSCPHLPPDLILDSEGKMRVTRSDICDAGNPPGADSIAALKTELASRDLAGLARNTGATFSAGTEPVLTVEYFGEPLVAIGPGGVPGDDSLGGRALFIVLHHLVRSRGDLPTSEWISLFELPRAAATIQPLLTQVARLGPVFAGRVDQLDRAARTLKAREGNRGSATACHVFTALPRVELLLRFWDREEDAEGRANALHPEFGRFTSPEDFDARAELLLDRGVLDQLGPEALYRLVGELTDRLLGPFPDQQMPDGPTGSS